jgi:pyruvate dehydrogenase E1 component
MPFGLRPTSAHAAFCLVPPRAAPRLGGEGLQHQDGSSHLVAATIPNCKAYDPAFAGEMAVIVDAGMREMLVEQQADVFYYVTLMNENYAQPTCRRKRMRMCCAGATGSALYEAGRCAAVTLLGSGAILTEVVKAAQQLAAKAWGGGAQRHELERTGARRQACEEAACAATKRGAILAQLGRAQGPSIAATDYVRAVPESVRAFVARQPPLPHARHRRLRAQRHAGCAAPLLCGGRGQHCAVSAQVLGVMSVRR